MRTHVESDLCIISIIIDGNDLFIVLRLTLAKARFLGEGDRIQRKQDACVFTATIDSGCVRLMFRLVNARTAYDDDGDDDACSIAAMSE